MNKKAAIFIVIIFAFIVVGISLLIPVKNSNSPKVSDSTSKTQSSGQVINKPSTDALKENQNNLTPAESTLFNEMVKLAGMEATLAQPGPYTLFVPTDEAINKLPEDTKNEFLASPDKLKLLVSHHVVPALVSTTDLMTLTTLTPIDGGKLGISNDGEILIDGKAKIVKADVQTSNGMIQYIDTVLLPTE